MNCVVSSKHSKRGTKSMVHKINEFNHFTTAKHFTWHMNAAYVRNALTQTHTFERVAEKMPLMLICSLILKHIH